jgi:hypothetical protein
MAKAGKRWVCRGETPRTPPAAGEGAPAVAPYATYLTSLVANSPSPIQSNPISTRYRDDKKEGPGRFYYYSTSKIYEGEWLDGTPKCGEFRALGPSEARSADTPNTETFNLPSLTLREPQAVLSGAVAEVRQSKGGQGGSRFSDEDLGQIRLAFEAFQDEEGLVGVDRLGELIGSLGIGMEEGQMELLLEHLGAEEGDDISYAEFVDIVVVVSGGV